MAKKELIFVAEGENGCSYGVYKKGKAYYIHGPSGHEHLCHPSVTSHEQIKNEILLVFSTVVVGTISSSELNS